MKLNSDQFSSNSLRETTSLKIINIKHYSTIQIQNLTFWTRKLKLLTKLLNFWGCSSAKVWKTCRSRTCRKMRICFQNRPGHSRKQAFQSFLKLGGLTCPCQGASSHVFWEVARSSFQKELPGHLRSYPFTPAHWDPICSNVFPSKLENEAFFLAETYIYMVQRGHGFVFTRTIAEIELPELVQAGCADCTGNSNLLRHRRIMECFHCPEIATITGFYGSSWNQQIQDMLSNAFKFLWHLSKVRLSVWILNWVIEYRRERPK